MSIIIVEVEKDKIVIASDSQMTDGEGWKRNKPLCKILKISDDIYCAGAGTVNILELFSVFLSKIEEDSLLEQNSKLGIMELMKEFSIWSSDYFKASTEQDIPQSQIAANEFLIVLGNSVWKFNNYIAEEIKEGEKACMGSGSMLASVALDMGANIEEALKMACKYDIYCSAPFDRVEIKKNV